jgi:mannose-6-phosphate isomerase-like protein (cupin superfamily)
MKATRLEEGFLVMSDESMTGRRLYSSATVTVIHMTVNIGREIAPHSADVDMEFFVIAGRGRFSVGDEELIAEKGTLVESPGKIPHGIANIGNESLELLAIKNESARQSADGEAAAPR